MSQLSFKRTFVIFSIFTPLVFSISKDQFYPFGAKAGDLKLPKNAEDISSSEIRLKTPIKFFSREYNGIYVNENGLVSFLTEIPSFFNVEFPLDYPIIAALYSDVDCRGSGDIWYRVANSSDVAIARSGEEVAKYFPKLSKRFRPEEVIVVTWERVGYFDRKSDKVNTFQIVITSDASNSFVLFHFANNGIEWIKALGKNRNMPDARAQSGIISGEGTFFTLPGSGQDQIQRLDKMSNVNQAGVWAFHLGPLPALQNIKQPDIKLTPEFQPWTASNCQHGEAMCHTSATCHSNDQGFCCVCQSGWYGNGETCLANGFPQRIRGKVNGLINSVRIEDQDLHCYVVTDDGRTYTAISKVGKLGRDMQTLTPISTPIAWLFAQRTQGAENGFSVTGGVFNYTADITFPDTGHSAKVNYVFKGLDAFDYLTADVYLSGSIPPLDRVGTKVRVEDYVEKFTRIRPGLIQSQSTRQLGFEGKSQTIRYDVTQTIQYTGCRYEKSDPAKRVTKLRSTRNYIIYDDPEQVVRFAMTSQVVPLNAREDPCSEKNCDANSYCQVQDDVARCVCQPGFVDDNRHCADIDECATRRHNCSPNAECYNTPGSFECSCKSGFFGNGISCEEDKNCEDLKCHPSADCVEDHRGEPVCQCWTGYSGDGKENCQVIPSEVKVSQFSNPESLMFDSSDSEKVPDSLESLGPVFHHYYEINNQGPHTIGNMQVQITWPLKDETEFVTYLPETPFVKYSSPNGDEFLDPCQMESDEDVNPLQLTSIGRRQRRQSRNLLPAGIGGEEYAGDYIENESDENDDDDEGARVMEGGHQDEDDNTVTYYDYDANFGVVLNETDASSPDFQDLGQLSPHAPPSYDYSHFDVYNQPKGHISHTTSTTTTAKPRGERRRPGSKPRSSTARPAAEAPPSAERVQLESGFGTGSGNVRFICKINLSPQETAQITIKAHLVSNTLRQKYKNAAHFKITSNAEIVANEAYTLSPGANADITTLVKLRDPSAIKQVPGKGIECGNSECSRYADCHISLDSYVELRKAQCFCLTGFKGNGQTCQRLRPHEESLDCRQSRNCDERANCLYDSERELFSCVCDKGFTGNGLTCRQDEENCAYADNCSPYATCDQESDNVFRCKCRPGYSGDGYECRVNPTGIDSGSDDNDRKGGDVDDGDDLRPNCIFSVCACPIGFIFDGNRNCQRDMSYAALQKPVARPNCYLRQCVCPNGYYLDKEENICLVNDISFLASVVYCDASGIQCGPNGRCIFDRARDHSICICNRGFIGDGFECEKIDPALIVPGRCLTHSECRSGEKCVLTAVADRSGRFTQTCVQDQPTSNENDYKGSLNRVPEVIETEPITDKPDLNQRPQNLCDRNSDCHKNGECVVDEVNNRYHCRCQEFYEGDGFNCQPAANAGCDIKKDCDANAGCYLDEISMTHYCRCKDGYSGDGYSCKEDIIGCNVIDNCGKHAICQFDQQEGGYRCKCQEALGFEGDGYTCRLVVPCWQNPAVCDRNAECIQLPGRQQQRQPEYGCKCKDGFLGDGFSCEALPTYDGNYLISSQGMALMKVPFDAGKAKPGMPIFVKPFMTAAAFGIDCFKGKLYMADTTGRSLRRMSYDGKNMEIFLEENVDFPEGVSVDWQARNIFWTDSGKRTIEVANLDSKTRKILFDEQIRNPRGIAVHPSVSRIFWSDWDPTHPRIESSNFDGTDRRILVDALIGMPNALDIDFERQELCWTDGGRSTIQAKDQVIILPKIECIGINLSNRHPLVELSANELPYGLALTQNRIFWTDWRVPGVHVADRVSGQRFASLPHVLQTMGRPFGIIAIPNECRRERSDCHSSPGFCLEDQVCLSNGHGGMACLCGDKGKVPSPQQLIHQLQQQQQQPSHPVEMSTCKDVFA